jgi:stage II sporulation protein D
MIIPLSRRVLCFAAALLLGLVLPSSTIEGRNSHMNLSVPPDSLTVRVGLIEDYDKLMFTPHGHFCVQSLRGDPLKPAIAPNVKWRVRIEKTTPAQFLLSVLVASFRKNDDAMQLAESFEERGVSAVVRQIGGAIEVEGRVVGDNTLYRVQAGNFKKEADAQSLMDSLEEDYAPRIVREVLRPARGTFDLSDADLNESLALQDGFRLVPMEDDASITLFGVRTGSGFKYEKIENREYGGALEFYLDNNGKLAVINELSVDHYLRGVVPSEMPAGFPVEALKVQAILARSVVLTEKTIKHLNDPFDLCAHVHCQVYSGITQENPRTTAAVDDTRGVVLVQDGLLLEPHYSAVCGGHTEDALGTWWAPSDHPEHGKPCTCSEHVDMPDLTTEAGVRQWILSSPDVCCNLSGLPLPIASDYTRKHFRWEVTYARSELEKIIQEKTGTDVGTLYDILPIRRGVSGRLMEIEILGSRQNLRIKRELPIRRALSPSALGSSCFIVEVENEENGDPKEFMLKGAGWGHGVGLCQCGAARQAIEGKSYEDILKFYFPGADVEKLY